MTRAWDKERVPDGKRTYEIQNTGRALYHSVIIGTKQRELMESEAIKLSSCMTRFLHTALGTAMSKSSC